MKARRLTAINSPRRSASAAASQGAGCIVISGQIELVSSDDEERDEFLDDLGLSEPGLNKLARALIISRIAHYFTAGEKEIRAWTIPLAPQRHRLPVSFTPTLSAGLSAPGL